MSVGHAVSLSIVCVATIILALWNYSGFYASDDMSYMGSVRSFVELGHIFSNFGGSRLSVVLPAAFAYWLTGHIISAVLVMAAFSVTLVVIAFFLGRILHGPNVGLVAAAVTGMNPLMLVHAGALLPDVVQANWFGLWLLVFAIVAGNRSVLFSQPFRTTGLFFTMGILIGLAYTAKLNGLVAIVPSGFLAAFCFGQPFRRATLVNGVALGGGLGVVILAESVLFWTTSDVPFGQLSLLHHLHNLAQFGDMLKRRMEIEGVWPWERFHTAFRLLYWLKWHVIFGVTGLLLYPRLPRRNWWVWGAVLWLVLFQVIGSTSLTNYRPSVLVDRYFIIFVLPLAVFFASCAIIGPSALFTIASGRFRRSGGFVCVERWLQPTIGAILVGVALVSGLVYGPKSQTYFWGGDVVRSYLRAYQLAVTQYPEYPVVFSRFLSQRLSAIFAWRRPGDLTAWQETLPSPPFVLIRPDHSSFGDKSLQELADRVQEPFYRVEAAKVYIPESRLTDLTTDDRGYLMDFQHYQGDSAAQSLYLPQRAAAVDLVLPGEGPKAEGGKLLYSSRLSTLPLFTYGAGSYTQKTDQEAVIRMMAGRSKDPTVNAFDRSSPNVPPAFNRGTIPPTTGTIVLRVDARAPAGGVGLSVKLFLYDGNGKVASTAETGVTPVDGRTVTLTLDARTDTLVTAFRLVFQPSTDDRTSFRSIVIEKVDLMATSSTSVSQ